MKLNIYFLLSAATANPLSLKKECAGGPEKWCQDYPTALKCGALDYCQQMMGLYSPMVKNSYMVCGICKKMIQIAEDMVENNATEAVLSPSLPSETAALEEVQKNEGKMCHMCTFVIQYFDDELEKNATQAQIGTMLTKGCQLLPEALVYIVSVLSSCYGGDKIGACPSSYLLGLEACSWGPSYWCKNADTAAQCRSNGGQHMDL
uniref:Saposin B-type domain-containing protein n=1 Tax=Anolis carolinensis TaxID=28377 RepID=A0A803SSC8_ANOCA